MLNDAIPTLIKATIGSTVGMAALAATSQFADEWSPTAKMVIEGLERMGSFFLLALVFVVVLLGLWKGLPAIMQWIRDRDTQFTTQLDRSRASREAGEQSEREARERAFVEFRTMLKEHTDTVATAIQNQTNHLDVHLTSNNKVLHDLRHLAEKAATTLAESESEK